MKEHQLIKVMLEEIASDFGSCVGKFCYLNGTWFEIGSLKESRLIGATYFMQVEYGVIVCYVNIGQLEHRRG
jgi:hypothetical protein